MWPLLALLGVITIIVGLFIAFNVHWGLGLLGLALIVAAIFAFARWEKSRNPPSAPVATARRRPALPPSPCGAAGSGANPS